MSPATRYALNAGAVSAVSGGSLAGGFAYLAAPGAAWAAAGFLVVAATAAGCGAWLAACHGRSPLAFLRALAGGALLRFLAIFGGAGLGVWQGRTQALGYLTGAGAAYGPLIGLELAWFLRRGWREDPRP